MFFCFAFSSPLCYISSMDTSKYRTLLEEEKTKIEAELSTVGRVNPQNPDDWEPTPEKMDIQRPDKNEAADAVEEFEMRTAIEVELEKRLNNVKSAIMRIGEGTYGTCGVGGEQIEEDRLRANPSAKTCKAHMNG